MFELMRLVVLYCTFMHSHQAAGLHFIAGVGIPVTTLHHFQGGYEGII
jgi:hypothetical protein